MTTSFVKPNYVDSINMLVSHVQDALVGGANLTPQELGIIFLIDWDLIPSLLLTTDVNVKTRLINKINRILKAIKSSFMSCTV